ncbi:hypothetical protein C8R46DRAFT_1311053 [Mycena filopes]|nr:hypothetical protein C8R46DRAFT_1311053 [Mycena filopes]
MARWAAVQEGFLDPVRVAAGSPHHVLLNSKELPLDGDFAPRQGGYLENRRVWINLRWEVMRAAARHMLRSCHLALRAVRFSKVPGVRYASNARSLPGIVIVSGGFALGLGGVWASKIHADSAVSFPANSNPKRDEGVTQSSLSALVRTYVVYTMCSIPALVDNAPWLLKTLSGIPGVRWITENIFVGGDSATETLPLVHALRSAKTGTVFSYSVEVNEEERVAPFESGPSRDSSHQKAILDAMLHCIDVAADFENSLGVKQTGRRTWVAVNITALLPDASALIRLSSHIISTRPPTSAPPVVFPGHPTHSDLDILYASKSPNDSVSDADATMLRELHADLERICIRAQARGVRVIIDVEYSWYQPALDALTLALMRRFNAMQSATGTPTQPLVYATFQDSVRTPSHFMDSSLYHLSA